MSTVSPASLFRPLMTVPAWHDGQGQSSDSVPSFPEEKGSLVQASYSLCNLSQAARVPEEVCVGFDQLTTVEERGSSVWEKRKIGER